MSLWNKTLSAGKEINRFFQMEYWIKLFNLTIVQNNSSSSYLFQKDSNRSRSDVEDEESSSSEYLPEQIQRGRGRGKRARQSHTTVCIFFSLLIVTTDFFHQSWIFLEKYFVTKNNYDYRHPGVNVVVPGEGGVVG